jgi:hypothetical protein
MALPNFVLIIGGAIAALIGYLLLKPANKDNSPTGGNIRSPTGDNTMFSNLILEPEMTTQVQMPDGYLNDKEIINANDVYIELLPKVGDRTVTGVIAISKLSDNDKKIVAAWKAAKGIGGNVANNPTQTVNPVPVANPAVTPVTNLTGLKWGSTNGLKIAIIDILKFNGNWMVSQYIDTDLSNLFYVVYDYYGATTGVRGGLEVYDVAKTAIRTNGQTKESLIKELKASLFFMDRAKYDAINDYESLNASVDAATRQRIVDNYNKYVTVTALNNGSNSTAAVPYTIMNPATATDKNQLITPVAKTPATPAPEPVVTKPAIPYNIMNPANIPPAAKYHLFPAPATAPAPAATAPPASTLPAGTTKVPSSTAASTIVYINYSNMKMSLTSGGLGWGTLSFSKAVEWGFTSV